MSSTKLVKTASFTDIHFGARQNSEEHNIDCLEFVDWFCEQVKADPDIDSIVFMGDWFEHRNSVNIQTMDYSYRAAKKLNELGLPIFFLVGNHDLYFRNSREIFSTVQFKEFANFTLIDSPTVIERLGDNGSALIPFVFENEYEGLLAYSDIPVWWGHFEFKGFIVTGQTIKMEHGFDAGNFSEPKRIFTGHFHKRQSHKNVFYIGNPFGTTFGDSGDTDRGMMVYDFKTDTDTYVNYQNSPRYLKINLSEVLENKIEFHPKTNVKCIVDVPITFEESKKIKDALFKRNPVRALILEETILQEDAQTNLEFDVSSANNLDDLMVKMLSSIDNDKIDTKLLIKIYQNLKTQE